MARRGFGNAFQEIFGGQPVDVTGTESAEEQSRRRTLAAYASAAPNYQLSDHLRESHRFRGAVYVALKVLAQQAYIADAKCFKWHREAREGGDQEGKKPLPHNHSLSRLVRRPNQWDSGGMLRYKMVQQLGLTGMSLVWRVDNGLGTPTDLWNVPTGTYNPVPISYHYPNGAFRIMPWYPGPLAMTPGAWSAGGVVVPAEQMIQTRFPHPLVDKGEMSPMQACSLPFDTIESIDTARFNTVRRGANPSGFVELDPTFKISDSSELTRVQQQLFQLLGGPNKAGMIAMLMPGMKLSKWEHGEVEVGWIESWNQLTSFVLSVYGITKSLAFMSDDTSFAALYAALKQFNLFTLCPLLEMLQDSFNHQLVDPFWGDEYFIEITPRPVHNEELLEQQLANDLKAGVRVVNELRVLRGLEPTDEPWGQERAFTTRENIKAEKGQIDEPDAADQERDEEQDRPENRDGRGSLGPREILNGVSRH